MKLSNSFNSSLRKFAYFLPSAIEQAYVIFINVIEMDIEGTVLNAEYAEKSAIDYLRSYCNSDFTVEPPYEDWETALY